MSLPDPNLPWPLPLRAVALIAEQEGCRLRSYKCPAGVWTCGWGATDNIVPGLIWTQAQADQRLCDELAVRTRQVQALITQHAEPNQLGALVSLAYNIGMAAFAKSSVLRAHNAGDEQAAARAFGLWNKATVNGVLTVLAGLTARRAAESALYLQPEPDAPPQHMPQAVAAETPIAASPIAQSGAVTAGAGVLGVLSQAGDQVGTVGTTLASVKTAVVDTLGVPADWFLPLVLVAAGGATLYHRHKQRAQGWA